MSGHSKWNNIKRKKEKTDGERAKIFTKLGREIAVIVKMGGPDPNANARLKDIIAKAKSNNMPNDNIQRCIKKAAGEGEADNYEDITYEGYGPNGIAVMVKALTDNRNRTAANMRHYFDKYGGNLGTNGCASIMFERKGIIIVEKENVADEDELTMAALDAGALDISDNEDCFEIITEPADVWNVSEALTNAGVTVADTEDTYAPITTVELTDPDQIKNMTKLVEMLEDDDDVQDVYHNWDEPDEE
ncbi:MAG: YebC/PmpR family DNA-binding transcriptional regulator [Clostridia bacterium]|nr:YebC/PmpR family DNA-binding transcriptional regulator [Clostridia bacterium]